MRTLDKRGMLLSHLEDKLGLSRTSLRQPINKGMYLRVSTLLKIAEVLECGVEDLISWQEGEGTDRASKYIEVNWDVLSNICKEQHTTLTAVSVKLGHSKQNFTNLRKQNGKIATLDVEKICEVLNVNKEQFIK